MINPIVFTTARGFETHKVCHSNNQNTLPPLPPNRYSRWSRDQPQPGSLSRDKGGRGERAWEACNYERDVICFGLKQAFCLDNTFFVLEHSQMCQRAQLFRVFGVSLGCFSVSLLYET